MLRLPPFDQIGANPVPDCVNADPANGVAGSILNMLMFNQLQHEAENLELLAGLTPSGTNLFQWTQAISRGIFVDELTGTGDLAIANLDAFLPAFLRGMRIGAVATASNTVTNPKLRVMNLNGVGLYVDFPILKGDGSALAVGEIVSGRIYRFEADGAGNVLISGGGLGTTNPTSNATPIAQAAKSGFNTQIFQSSTRVLLSQSGANVLATALSGLSFTKKSATSLVRVSGSFIFRAANAPGSGYGPTYYVLSFAGQSPQQATSNAYPSVVALTPVNLTFGTKASPIAAGTYSFMLQFGRNDAQSWSGTFLPSNTDEAGYPPSTLFQIAVDEVEPT